MALRKRATRTEKVSPADTVTITNCTFHTGQLDDKTGEIALAVAEGLREVARMLSGSISSIGLMINPPRD